MRGFHVLHPRQVYGDHIIQLIIVPRGEVTKSIIDTDGHARIVGSG